jgi:hypothetical protein
MFASGLIASARVSKPKMNPRRVAALRGFDFLREPNEIFYDFWLTLLYHSRNPICKPEMINFRVTLRRGRGPPRAAAPTELNGGFVYVCRGRPPGRPVPRPPFIQPFPSSPYLWNPKIQGGIFCVHEQNEELSPAPMVSLGPCVFAGGERELCGAGCGGGAGAGGGGGFALCDRVAHWGGGSVPSPSGGSASRRHVAPGARAADSRPYRKEPPASNIVGADSIRPNLRGTGTRPDGGIGPYTKVRMSVGADALIGPSPVSRPPGGS